MAQLRMDDTSVTGTVVFKDRKGNVALPVGMPVWSVSPPDSVVAIQVSGDGMSAVFGPVGVGTALIVAVADGISASGSIDVVGAAVATGEIVFGDVT